MASDAKNAESARAHIEAAKAAPHRKELELNQAENFARLIHCLLYTSDAADE